MPNTSDLSSHLNGVSSLLPAEIDHYSIFGCFNSGMLVSLLTLEGNIIFINDVTAKFINRTLESVVGKSFLLLPYLSESNCFKQYLHDALAKGHIGESSRFTLQVNDSQAVSYELDICVSPIINAHGDIAYFLVFAYDIKISEEQLKANRGLQEKINYIANYDRLTHLPNRILLIHHLKQALKTATKNQSMVVILVLGLDRFKFINEIFNNAGGDEILRITGSRLVNALSEKGIVARIGGDEFAIIIEQSLTPMDDLTLVGHQILDIFSQPYIIDGQSVYIMGSVGIALFPNHGSTSDDILKNANLALQQAKMQGMNNVFLYDELSHKSELERWQLEVDLRKALTNRELQLYYQPRIDLQSGKIFGVEALMRWQHPTRGLILPEEFITIAEETGLIFTIGEWALEKACQQKKLWVEQGIKLGRIGVNLSAKQFHQKNLVNKIENILADLNLDPSLLEIELTESLLVQDIVGAVTIMKQLKELGVYIALDDFGTGYSSLNYLRSFPVDILKIDRSFISELTEDKNSIAITEAIIMMAHRLNLIVIAEGVETLEQLNILKTIGCDQIQGYHYAKPLPASELISLLNNIVNTKN